MCHGVVDKDVDRTERSFRSLDQGCTTAVGITEIGWKDETFSADLLDARQRLRESLFGARGDPDFRTLGSQTDCH